MQERHPASVHRGSSTFHVAHRRPSIGGFAKHVVQHRHLREPRCIRFGGVDPWSRVRPLGGAARARFLRPPGLPLLAGGFEHAIHSALTDGGTLRGAISKLLDFFGGEVTAQSEIDEQLGSRIGGRFL